MFNKQQKSIIALATLAVVLATAIDQAVALEPMVETGVSQLSPDGKHVAVHLPAVFDLKLDTRGPRGQGFRLQQNVLSGMVSLNIDRARDSSTGKMYGPIQVKVFGMTMYDNEAPPISSSLVPSIVDPAAVV